MIELPIRSQRSVFDLAIPPSGRILLSSAIDYPSVWYVDTSLREVVDQSDFGEGVTRVLVV